MLIAFSPELWTLIIGATATLAGLVNYLRMEIIKLVEGKIKVTAIELQNNMDSEINRYNNTIYQQIERNRDAIVLLKNAVSGNEKINELRRRNILSQLNNMLVRLNNLENYISSITNGDRQTGYVIRGDSNQNDLRRTLQKEIQLLRNEILDTKRKYPNSRNGI